MQSVPIPSGDDLGESSTRAKFIAAMDDDLNSAMALGILHDLAREINRARAEGAAAETLAPAQADSA